MQHACHACHFFLLFKSTNQDFGIQLALQQWTCIQLRMNTVSKKSKWLYCTQWIIILETSSRITQGTYVTLWKCIGITISVPTIAVIRHIRSCTYSILNAIRKLQKAYKKKYLQSLHNAIITIERKTASSSGVSVWSLTQLFEYGFRWNSESTRPWLNIDQ